ESISSKSHLGSSSCRNRSHWCWSNCSRSSSLHQSTVAAFSGSCRCPVGIAPAQFVGTVLPHQLAGAVLPVIDNLTAIGSLHLSAGSSCHSCGCKQDCYFVQFLHGSPLGD